MTLRTLSPSPDAGAPPARIAEAAYALWVQAGRTHGQDMAHWLQAERACAPEPAENPSTIGDAPPALARKKPRARRLPAAAKAPSRGHIYQLRFLGKDGATKLVMAVFAASDADALAEAEHVADGRTLEVWRGDQRVGALAGAAARSTA